MRWVTRLCGIYTTDTTQNTYTKDFALDTIVILNLELEMGISDGKLQQNVKLKV